MTEQVISMIAAGIGLITSGILVFLLVRTRRGGQTDSSVLELQKLFSQQLQHMSREVNERLREHTHAVNESKDFLASRVSAAERTVRTVSAGLGKLEQATSQLQKTSEDIVSFQTMLKHPKIRGSFGEVLLANLLSEVLPADRFDLQYILRGSGEIADATIKLQDGYIVAVDAKFPLANYEIYSNEQETDRKARFRKEFIRDVKKHITDISKKYIVPAERTLDYAFMYIPLEGVYYETMIQPSDGESLWEFCLKCHVIPTSPNSFLAYLQTVLVGLRGMKVEQQAREIMQHLGQLRQDFGVFSEEFSTVGKHLANAKNRFDDSARRLDKLGNRLDQIDTGDTYTKLAAGEDSEEV
ncbi:MAG: DNA recombination protein RmuC [Candidatus Andersenbacteria bacterium]|nr:DNA recombination protein RmuC [Candidatus Andersenbacteria bacterium]MBI3250453.1 DNA recombination protein RmuC [Candidatus Andersenbacteria bacterium]